MNLNELNLSGYTSFRLLSVAVLIGTMVGARTLHRISEQWFRRLVAVVLLALGAFMLSRAFS